MPRYYFHLHNDIESIDEDGRELADLDEARRCAEFDARQMAAESVRHGRLDLTHYVEVAGEDRRPLLRVSFGEVVAIVGEARAPPPLGPNPDQ